MRCTLSRPRIRIFWNIGFADFAKRWLPILDVFEKENVNFALEVHPTEIAFDIASAKRALAAVKNHPRFGFNYDPVAPWLSGRGLCEIHPRIWPTAFSTRT